MSSSPKKYYAVVLDFEATCDDKTKLDPQEIIEFPSVLLEFSTDGSARVASETQFYVRPDVNPELTRFCTELTGITQDKMSGPGVDNLEATLKKYDTWLRESIGPETDPSKVLFVTCGDWDLVRTKKYPAAHSTTNCPRTFCWLIDNATTQYGWMDVDSPSSWVSVKEQPYTSRSSVQVGNRATMLPSQLGYLGLPIPPYFRCWMNIKTMFRYFYFLPNSRYSPPVRKMADPGPRFGMPEMLRLLNLKLEGRHHSGIDDCHNIARILMKMHQDGCPLSPTTRLTPTGRPGKRANHREEVPMPF